MYSHDSLTNASFHAHGRALTGPPTEEVGFNQPDDVQVRVRRQFRIVRVVITTEKRGRFEIVVLDERDVGNDSAVDSLSVPPTKHRRTWNKAALQTQRAEADPEGNPRFP